MKLKTRIEEDVEPKQAKVVQYVWYRTNFTHPFFFYRHRTKNEDKEHFLYFSLYDPYYDTSRLKGLQSDTEH